MQVTQTSQVMHQCIQNCRDCHAICEHTVLYCLQRGGALAEAKHMQRLLDCSQMCQISEDFMLRDSPLHARICGICEQACLRCAESCEHLGMDQQLQACAQRCRQCAQTCQQMAAT